MSIMEQSVYDTYVSKRFVRGLCAYAAIGSVVGLGMAGCFELLDVHCKSEERRANIQLLSKGEVVRECPNADHVRINGHSVRFNCDGRRIEWDSGAKIKYLDSSTPDPLIVCYEGRKLK
jgi:hypothetical protein